jgi:hypothetical protein
MSYKVLQLSPQASTRFTRRRIVFENGMNRNSVDAGFLESWFDSDFDLADGDALRTNWGAISGLALAIAVSASFWAGMVWIVARVWR